MYLIGIDVGGTNTKFGLIENHEILKTVTLPTNTFDVIRQVVNGAKEIVQSAGRSWEDVGGVAVGFPGMIVDNILKDSPNIGLQNCNLKELLAQELDKPVFVRNDADMAAIAEHKLGAGNDCNNMVMITIGTGVGGGIIIDRQLFSGNGGAGELGHIVINKNGLKCNCGRNGCAEQYISLLVLDRLTRELIIGYPDSSITVTNDKMIDACDLVKSYKRNDACAIEVLQRYTSELANFILNICNMFRPERIVIGGGLSYAPEIVQMVAKICKDQNYGYKESPAVEIVTSSLGNDAGILGAVVCFEESLNTEEIEIHDETVSVTESKLSEEPSVIIEESEATINEPAESLDLLNLATEKSEEIASESNSEEPLSYNQDMLDRINDMLKNK